MGGGKGRVDSSQQPTLIAIQTERIVTFLGIRTKRCEVQLQQPSAPQHKVSHELELPNISHCPQELGSTLRAKGYVLSHFDTLLDVLVSVHLINEHLRTL